MSTNPSNNLSENIVKNDLFSVQKRILQIGGMFTWDTENSLLPTSLQFLKFYIGKFLEIFLPLVMLKCSILYAKTTYDQLYGENLDVLVDSLVSTIIAMFSFFSTVYFILKRGKLIELLKYVNENYRVRSAKGLTYIKVEDSYKKANLFSLIWIILCLIGTTFWALFPIMAGIRALPLKCWYPFDQTKPIIYEILYVVQFIAQTQIAISFGGASMLITVFVMLICGQYDILFCSLQNIHVTALISLNASVNQIKSLEDSDWKKKQEINQFLYSKEHISEIDKFYKNNVGLSEFIDYKSKEFQTQLKLAFQGCVQHHRSIIESCKLFEDFYNQFCLIKSIQVTMQLCLLIFVVMNTTTSFLRGVTLAQYIILTILELYLITYFGEILKYQSLKIGDFLMKSPWNLNMKILKHEILILLVNSKRPALLTAGKFYHMDLNRFQKVIMGAFSYLTLLQNLRNKRNG